MAKKVFTVVIERGKGGYFIADVPELPGCRTQAKTKKELMERVKEAISLYLEETRKAKLKKLLKNVSIVKANVKAYA